MALELDADGKIVSVPDTEPSSLPKDETTVKAASTTTVPQALNQDVKQPSTPVEKVIDPTLQNLIEEAKKRNASLTGFTEPPVTVIPNDHAYKLLQIKSALRDSGADSMQQEKTYERIKEVLGW